MVYFGIICPFSSGHLNTSIPLARELKNRGHRVAFIGSAEAEALLPEAEFEFCAIDRHKNNTESMEEILDKLGRLSGIDALRYTAKILANGQRNILEFGPQAIKNAEIDILLVDQAFKAGGTVAEYLQIPFVTICSAVVLNRDPSVPPHYTFWRYSPSAMARWRNRLGYRRLNQITKPIAEVISEYRQKWNLLPENENVPQELAHISHQPAEFEFPRENLPENFYFTGPYHYSSSRQLIDFPWNKLNGKPLIYASMGTLQNRRINVFEKIAIACKDIDAQLVISLGGSTNPESLPKLAGNPLVVKYAPQLELLKKTSLVITHAGMNTTLETLANGVPMVAIPVTNDQPGIAARIIWSGVGEAIPVDKLNSDRLGKIINKVLKEDSYKKNAIKLQKAIERAGGVSLAVDIIEKLVTTKKP